MCCGAGWRELLPLLTPRELSNLKRVQKQLKRERRLAFEGLVETLRSKRYLQLIAALQGWLKQPLCTALGEEPVLSWLPEWKSAALTGLMLHPGWRCRGYGAAGDHEALHDLRKRIKAARYALTNLEELEGALLSSWIERFKAIQEQLGSSTTCWCCSAPWRTRWRGIWIGYCPRSAA